MQWLFEVSPLALGGNSWFASAIFMIRCTDTLPIANATTATLLSTRRSSPSNPSRPSTVTRQQNKTATQRSARLSPDTYIHKYTYIQGHSRTVNHSVLRLVGVDAQDGLQQAVEQNLRVDGAQRISVALGNRLQGM